MKCVQGMYAQSCPTLCNPMDCCSPPGSSVHGTSQARILGWVAIPYSRSSWPRDRTQDSCISCIGKLILYLCATWEATKGRTVLSKWKGLGGQHLYWKKQNPLIDNTKGSFQFSSVAQLCPTLCDPMNHSMPGLPVHHQLPEFTQTHVHGVGDAIQPPHPLSSPSPRALNLSQHQGLFKWVSSSHQMAKVLHFQLHHQSFQWIFRTDFH